MNTIVISAIVVALIGGFIFALWKTKGFKKLREKNRAAEVKEQKANESIASLAQTFAKQDQRDSVINEAKDKLENDLPPNSSNYHQVVNTTPLYTEIPISFSTTATVSFAPEKPIENPPKVRVEIRSVYDYIKSNIIDYLVIWNNELCEFSKRSTNETKDIVVKNDTIYVADLDTKFQLLTSETALFNNLAKEESERRAIEASAITHEKLKKFAEKLPRVEKVVGVKAAVKKAAPVKKVAKGKVK